MLNPFFLQGSAGEQGLIQDLINEHLKIHGVDVHYIPRQYITQNSIIEEVIESKFNNAYPIEAYLVNYDGYGQNTQILSKFGIQALNELVIEISRERFESYISPLITGTPGIKESSRPKEGDLIYFPLGDRLFEIKFVEHEKPFYQLKGNYTYELRCELFRYQDEVIDTSIEEIDDSAIESGFIQTLRLIGIGTTAVATASIVNGGIRLFTLSNRGHDYKNPPTVAISSSPTVGGRTAVGIATLIDGLVDCDGLESGRVQGIELVNAGSGYSLSPAKPPTVIILGGGGAGAISTATVANGTVGVITVTNAGSGYIHPPTVTFSSPGAGITARGVAYINSTTGNVTAIRVIDGGSGYTSPPTITLTSPSVSGIGTYTFNEVVVGSSSSTTARVRSYDVTTGSLEVAIISGEFIEGEQIVGQTSNASFTIFFDNNKEDISDPYTQNDELQNESAGIIDFSEENPFGMP
jgi:hypothetical protein